MESDFLSEKNAIEYELNSLIKENNKLRDQLNEKPEKNLTTDEEKPLWNLSKDRLNGVTNYLREQNEHEMAAMREQFSERKNVIQHQIKDLDVEIQSAEQLFSRMFHLMSNLVEQAGKVDISETSEIEETKIVEIKVDETKVEQSVRPVEEKSIKLEETTRKKVGEKTVSLNKSMRLNLSILLVKWLARI